MKVLNLSRSSTCSNIRRNNGDSRNFDWLYVVFSRRHCRLSRRLHSHQQSSRMRFQNIPMRSNACNSNKKYTYSHNTGCMRSRSTTATGKITGGIKLLSSNSSYAVREPETAARRPWRAGTLPADALMPRQKNTLSTNLSKVKTPRLVLLCH